MKMYFQNCNDFFYINNNVSFFKITFFEPKEICKDSISNRINILGLVQWVAAALYLGMDRDRFILIMWNAAVQKQI